MSLRVGSIGVNTLRVGVLAGLMAVSMAGCKKGPFRPMPRENVSPEVEQVLKSAYKEGLVVQNDPEFKCVETDTVKYREEYTQNPDKIQRYFNNRIYDDTHYWDDNGVYEFDDPDKIRYVVTDTLLYTSDGVKPYMAIARYRKVPQ